MAGEPILIVDDTPVNLKLTRLLLANQGYELTPRPDEADDNIRPEKETVQFQGATESRPHP